MLLGHGMVNRDELLILHTFHCNCVVVLGFFRFQGRQSHTAAADHRISGAVNHISADGADIELAPHHIG